MSLATIPQVQCEILGERPSRKLSQRSELGEWCGFRAFNRYAQTIMDQKPQCRRLSPARLTPSRPSMAARGGASSSQEARAGAILTRRLPLVKTGNEVRLRRPLHRLARGGWRSFPEHRG